MRIPPKEGIRDESRGIGGEREGDFADNFINEELISCTQSLLSFYVFLILHIQPTFAQFYIVQNS